MVDDVVTELDRWLAMWSSHFGGTQSVDMEVVKRARDEIVALRKLTDGDWVWKQITDARNEALEEAARKAEHYEAPIWSAMIAAAIRALKEAA